MLDLICNNSMNLYDSNGYQQGYQDNLGGIRDNMGYDTGYRCDNRGYLNDSYGSRIANQDNYGRLSNNLGQDLGYSLRSDSRYGLGPSEILKTYERNYQAYSAPLPLISETYPVLPKLELKSWEPTFERKAKNDFFSPIITLFDSDKCPNCGFSNGRHATYCIVRF